MARSEKVGEPPPEPSFDSAALDQLIGETSTPEQLELAFRQMKKRIVERMLGAELTHRLGYAPGEARPAGQANHRNCTTPKAVRRTTAPCRWTPRGIGRGRSRRSSSPRASGGCRASTPRSSRSTPGG